MKKIIIVIGIVIAVFVVWVIVDQSGLISNDIDLEKTKTVFIGVPYDDEMPLQLETVLISCKLQKEEGAIFTIQLSFENATHYIDNTTCKWNLMEGGYPYRLIEGEP